MGKLDVMGKKNIFGKTKFTLYEISKFIDAKKMAFSFATITTKENATFTIDEENFSFYFKSYSEGDYDKIIREASEWMIKIVRAEDWDPLIYEIKRTTTEAYQEIDSEFILVKDNSFAGLISYNSCFDLYEIHYGLIDDYKGKPILCWCKDGYGSSDCDMMYTEKYYLVKKCQEK